jgi:hypothetical protein
MAQYLDYEGLKEYDRLLKQHIPKSYKYEFEANQWTQQIRTTYFYIDIPISTHNIANPYVAICCDAANNPVIVSIFIYQNKNIHITTEQKFNGFLIIKQKEN